MLGEKLKKQSFNFLKNAISNWKYCIWFDASNKLGSFVELLKCIKINLLYVDSFQYGI